MCKKTIENTKNQNEPEKEKGTWAEDQQNRGYYYDDAHGYEIYKDEVENEDDDDSQK